MPDPRQIDIPFSEQPPRGSGYSDQGGPIAGLPSDGPIRWASHKYIMAMGRLLRASFMSAPTEGQILEMLRMPRVYGMVYVHPPTPNTQPPMPNHDLVLGMAVYGLADHAYRILILAVLPECRRQKIATALIGNILHSMARSNRSRTETYVRDSSLAAQLFFRAVGFRATSIKSGMFEDPDEDGFRFVRRAAAGDRRKEDREHRDR